MSDERPPDDELELDDELEQLNAEPLRVESVDPETGERRLEGFVTRAHLAQAIVERDELH